MYGCVLCMGGGGSVPSTGLKKKVTVSVLRRLVVYSISNNIDWKKPVNMMTYYINTFKSILLINRKANEHYGLAT